MLGLGAGSHNIRLLYGAMPDKVDFQSELKPKYDILFHLVLIFSLGKIKITTNNKISYFGFYFDWKSTWSFENFGITLIIHTMTSIPK